MAGPLLLHLALLIVFSFSSQAAQVLWSSPAAGTVFGPGDTLIVSWTANSTTKVSKNSTTVFRLCETDSQGSQNETTNCGEPVTPLIQQSAGSYTTSFALPNVTNKFGAYLEMNDTSGRKSISPNFSLSPAPGLFNATLVNNNTRAELPDINANHVPVPAAALAIPLSFVGLILFCCVFLFFHHHRKLKQERACDLQRLALAREKLGYGLKQASPKSSGSRVIYLDSRPTSPGQNRSFKEPVKRGYSYYQDVYTPVYYSRTRSESTPPESPRYHYQQHPPHSSSRSHSRREGEPRQYTRDPFYWDMERTPMEPLERGPSQDYFQLPHEYQHTSRPRRDPRNVPAGLFRSVKSSPMQETRDENQTRHQNRSVYPVPPGLEHRQSYRSEPRSERGHRSEQPRIRISRATTASTLPTAARRHFFTPPTPPERRSRPFPTHQYRSEPSSREMEREEEDAHVNEGVIMNYLAPSPRPSPTVPACLSPRVPAPPDRLHVRREARLLDFEKPLPRAPSRGYGYAVDEDSVYRAVADALGRR